MRLLVITGIVNSSWWPIYSVLDTSIKKLTDAAPDCTNLIHQLVKQKETITTSKLNEVLGIQDEDNDYIFGDEKSLFTLTQLTELPKNKIIIFYSNPIIALANALSQQHLTLKECEVLIDEWAEQINNAFRFYQQHKDICLLLDSDDVSKHAKLASELISGFVGQEIKLGEAANSVSPDTLIAAHLLLSERDDLFEVYDEIRSAAPIFEKFTLSGFADNQTLANDSLIAIQGNRTATANLDQKILKSGHKNKQLESKLTELESGFQQKTAQLDTSQALLKASEAKLLTSQAAIEEANKKHQAAIAATQEQKSSLAKNVEQLTNKLTEAEGSFQQQAAQFGTSHELLKASEAKLLASQVTLEESNKNNQAEIAMLKHDLNTCNAETTKFEQVQADLESENELVVLQVGQLQEELELTFGQSKTDRQRLTKKLSESEANLQQKSTQLAKCQESLKANEAKLVESQTSIEETNKSNQAKIATLKHDLNTCNAETTKFKQVQADLQSENELLVLQIGQLQEELELTFGQSKTDLERLSNQLTESVANFNQKEIQIRKIQETLDVRDAGLIASKSALEEMNNKHQAEIIALKQDTEINNTESIKLQQSHVSLQSENELLVLQIGQLQEELETLYLSNQQFTSQKNEQTQLLNRQSQAQLQIQSIEAENQIATLQINQLQEELEFYYQQLHEKESKTVLTQLTNAQRCQNVFEQSNFGSFDIQGAYETDGYQDIHLLLNNVQLADGRQFPTLNVKLIEVSGRPGLEFRPSEENAESSNLQWREDMQDEYGFFIRYIPNPNSEQQDLQQKTNESLCASDRLLVLSIASKLADVFQMTTDSDLPDGKLRDWKLIAINLKGQVEKLPNWMSFDTLTLVEEMRTDNYEHLWLRFNNLLVNDHLRPEFEVKFAVTDLVEASDVFSKNIMLEIRQQADQQSPLQAWPPILQDEYGYKLQAFVDLIKDELNIQVEEKLSGSDYQFLVHLLKNMSNFLQVLAEQEQYFERPIQNWLAVGSRITEISQFESEITQGLAVVPESSENAVMELELLFSEHVDLGGYQHLVYQQSLPGNEQLLLKIRAENINLQTKTAELYLELRTGNDKVPMADSEFFDEDEFGPRVLMPLAVLQGDMFVQRTASPEMKLIAMFSEEMNNVIDRTSELDKPQRALWQAMLANK
jgi:hypothetical protein